MKYLLYPILITLIILYVFFEILWFSIIWIVTLLWEFNFKYTYNTITWKWYSEREKITVTNNGCHYHFDYIYDKNPWKSFKRYLI